MRNKRVFLIPLFPPSFLLPSATDARRRRRRCSTALINFLLRLRDGISQLSLVRSFDRSVALRLRCSHDAPRSLAIDCIHAGKHSTLTQRFEFLNAQSRIERVEFQRNESVRERKEIEEGRGRGKIWSADRFKSALMSPSTSSSCGGGDETRRRE